MLPIRCHPGSGRHFPLLVVLPLKQERLLLSEPLLEPSLPGKRPCAVGPDHLKQRPMASPWYLLTPGYN